MLKKHLTRDFMAQIIIEFGPILVFLIEFERRGFIKATKFLIAATILSAIFSYFRHSRLAPFPVFVLLLTLFFGTSAVILENPRILILRDSFYDITFAVAIVVGLLNKKLLLKYLFSSIITLSDRGWRTVSVQWTAFFFFAGTINEIIRRFGTEASWVYFKVFIAVLTPLFILFQFFYIKDEHLPHNPHTHKKLTDVN